MCLPWAATWCCPYKTAPGDHMGSPLHDRSDIRAFCFVGYK